MRNNISRVRLAIWLLLLATVLPCTLPAQYFGQNKVRYRSFDFEVLKTQHFDIYYYKDEEKSAADMGRMAERWYVRLSTVLDWDLSSRQPLIVYASSQDFRSTTVLPGDIGEGTGGVTEALRRRIVMPMAGAMAETDHVLGHELVHAFQYDITARSGAGGVPGVASLPLWFVEGMAEYLSLGAEDPHTAMWMRDAVRQEKIPSIKDLNDPKYFPYRWGQAFWAYVGGRYGDQVVGQILRAAGRSGSAQGGIQDVLKTEAGVISDQWRDALTQHFEPVLRASAEPSEGARIVVSKERHGGELNVSPVLSPDGTQMVFFSSKDLFSIDLYLADASTGEIKRKLTKTATDPHVDSLQFINSAGAWSSDGEWFAYGTLGGGKAELVIQNAANGNVRKRIRFDDLREIYNPTWSPDGSRIAFSANVAGVTDLFVIEVESERLRRLTDDVFADLQPAWSPDGKRIAMVTDRFSSNLENLSFGHYELALVDPESGEVQPLQAFNRGKHTNPQWSPDGGSLYFISDYSGKSDIYRMTVHDGSITQVTNLQTGVTGITSLSPAFSTAAKSGKLIYSVYQESDYNIFAIDSPQAGVATATSIVPLQAGVLPPADRTNQVVTRLLRAPGQGLVPGEDFESTDYKAKLKLDYIAPPQVGVGYSSYGGMAAGGTALYFSDLLGFHNLVVGLQTSTLGDASDFLRNFAGTVTYQNQRSRWTWGITGGQVPYVTGGFGQGLIDLGNGQVGLAQQNITFWQINRQVAGIFSYPFSRAQRLEFTTGFTNVDFAGRTQMDVFDPVTGQFLGQRREDLATPDSLNMGTFSSALVYDTSLFGGTSPILGQRYRFEVGGNSGTLNYGTLLLDYRRYVKLGPFTLAGRGFHYGRYGGSADDGRLQDLFLGYDSLMRGYDPNSFDVSECGPQVQTTGACPVFDQLQGTRMAVGNVELRLPVLGPLGVIPSRRFPPMEIAPFYDVGVAWDRAQRPSLFGGSAATGRNAVSSYGASLRLNLLGFAIGQLSLVHPNDRPMKDWIWQFSLLPGF